MRNLLFRFRAPAGRAWLAALLLLALAACGDAVSPERAARLRALSGGEQVALLGETVQEPLRVRVEDAAGNPLRGVAVEWRVAAGGGTLDAARTVTDDDGVATVRWTLGGTAGEQQVEARVAGAPALRFAATATAVAHFQLSPRHVRLGTVGDEQVLRLLTRGTDGVDVASGAVTWHSSDPSVVSVFGGRLRAAGTGVATVIALGDGVADTVLVSVGIASTAPVVLTGDGVQRTSPSELWIAGTASGNGYAGEAWMEWGRQPDLSDAAEAGRAALPATGTRSVGANLTGLSLGETVYFRVAAQTGQGLSRGSIASYTVAAPGQPTGLVAQLGASNYLLKLTWTVPERGYSYAAEYREPGQAEWTSTSLFYSSTGGYWAYYPSLDQTRTVEYRVRSCNAVGCTYSEVVQAVIPRLEPPQGLAATVTDSGHVRLAWTDVTPETGWEIHRRTAGEPAAQVGTAARNATSYVDRTVVRGVTYLYSVRAVLSFGGRRSAPSGEVAATTGGGETYPPTAVTGTGVQSGAASQLTLRGTATGNGFAGHAWNEWGFQPDLSDAAIAGRDTLPATGTKNVYGSVTGLGAGTTVYFRTVAQNEFATVRGAIASYTVALPEAPTEFRALFAAPNYRMNLYWTEGARTAGFAVEQRTQGETEWRSTRLFTTGTGGTWGEYPDMTVSRTIEYRVRACNGVGCVYSPVIAVAVQRLEPPQNLQGSVNAARKPVLTWSAYPTATSFQVWRRIQGDPAPATLRFTTPRYATTFTDSTALEGVTYAYTMRSALTPGARLSVFTPEVFVTAGDVVAYPPTATTGKAVQPTDGEFQDPTRATLNGTAAGNGFGGHAWIEYSASPDMAGATVLGRDTLPPTGTKAVKATVSGLVQGSTFYFRAVAENRYGTVRGAIASYTVAPPAPATGLRVEYGTTDTYLLKMYWTPGERSTAYAGEYREPGQTQWTDGGLIWGGPGGYWAFYPSLDSTRTIEVRVRNCNAVGCTHSAPVSQLIQRFDPPANVAAQVNAAGDVVVTWTDSPMETSYDIRRRVQGSGAAYTTVGTGRRNAVSFTDTTAASGVTYEYVVRAVNLGGPRYSPFSPPAVVTVP